MEISINSLLYGFLICSAVYTSLAFLFWRGQDILNVVIKLSLLIHTITAIFILIHFSKVVS